MSQDSILHVDSHDGFERAWSRAERVVFVLLFILIAAALAGVFGGGPLSRRMLSVPARPVSITYDHFLRDRGQAQLTVETTAPLGPGPLRLIFDKAFLDHGRISGSIPAAIETRALAGGVEYDFALGAEGRGRIVFAVEPQGIGPATGVLTVAGSPTVLHSFIYP